MNMAAVEGGVGIEREGQMAVEKSMLLASLQDYNEKLVLEVTQLREKNADLSDQLLEKDSVLRERDARFEQAKTNIDKTIGILKGHVMSSLRERDESLRRVEDLQDQKRKAEKQVKNLEENLSDCKAELSHQKQLVSRSLKALAKYKVASTMALQERTRTNTGQQDRSRTLGREKASGSPMLKAKAASAGQGEYGGDKDEEQEEVERELVEHMEVEHLLDTVGVTLQTKILTDKCDILDKQLGSVNTILKDERDYRLLLEQRQGASQRTISQLISLLFVDKSESQRKKQLVNSLVSSTQALSGGKRVTKGRPKRIMISGGAQSSRPSTSNSKEKRLLDSKAVDALLDCNAEIESMRKAQFALILSLLEDELHLLDLHYDRLLQEKERKKDEDTSRYMQSLIDRVLEEIKEKGAQISIFSGILKKNSKKASHLSS